MSRYDIDLEPLTLNVRGTSSVTCSNIQNLSNIEQTPAELLIIWRIFAHVVTL